MKIKKITSCMMITIITFIACVQRTQAISVDETPADNVGKHSLINTVRYAGSGNAPYVENGVQYLQTDNIIEVSVSLPTNTYAVGITEMITYDMNQLELITGFGEMRNTMSTSLLNDGFMSFFDYASGNTNQILIHAATPELMGANVSGGVIANLKFRVKHAEKTTSGNQIDIRFSNFTMTGYIGGERKYFHKGFDPSNAHATTAVSLPTLSMSSHKVPAKEVIEPIKPEKPEVEQRPSIEINKEVIKGITVEKLAEIAALLKTKNYSFLKLGNERLNGKKSFVSIVKDIIEKTKQANKDNTKYKTYSFSSANQQVNTSAIKPKDRYCYTHYIFLGMSILLIIATLSFDRFQNYRMKQKWEV